MSATKDGTVNQHLPALESAISDVSFWTWWAANLPESFQLEFGTQLWKPTGVGTFQLGVRSADGPPEAIVLPLPQRAWERKTGFGSGAAAICT